MKKTRKYAKQVKFVKVSYESNRETCVDGYSDWYIAGVKGETLLEFASNSANISRQTTSRNKSANDILYVVREGDIPFVEEYLKLRAECLNA